MGYIKHDAIIVTSWNDEAIIAARDAATRCCLQAIGPCAPMVNGYRTMLVCPDGSKEGWTNSDDGDSQRAEFIDYLRGIKYEDGSSCLEWVAVAYGNDDRKASISDHAWRGLAEKPE